MALSFIQRSIKKPGTGNGEKIVRFGNAYFHLRESCIAKHIADFTLKELIVRPEIKADLELVHHRFLRHIIGDKYDRQS